MSAIQLPNTYPEDERWLEAGADAFALHIAACCYSDKMDKDGLVPKVMVPRLAIMVDPSRVESAVESLVDTGFWSSAGKNFRINRYLEDKIGLSAEEKISTRNRWAENKRIRRQHNNGNHSACSRKTCKYAEVSSVDSMVDSSGDSTSMSAGSPASTTLPVTTRHYPNPVGVSGSERVGGRPSGPASAGATASRRASRADAGGASPVHVDNPYGPPPYGVSLESWVRVNRMTDAGVFDGPVDADPAESLDGLIPAGGAGGP